MRDRIEPNYDMRNNIGSRQLARDDADLESAIARAADARQLEAGLQMPPPKRGGTPMPEP